VAMAFPAPHLAFVILARRNIDVRVFVQIHRLPFPLLSSRIFDLFTRLIQRPPLFLFFCFPPRARRKCDAPRQPRPRQPQHYDCENRDFEAEWQVPKYIMGIVIHAFRVLHSMWMMLVCVCRVRHDSFWIQESWWRWTGVCGASGEGNQC
jgi:hypothetical protein